MDSKNFLEGTFDPYIGHEIIEIKENYVKSSLEVKDFHKQPMGMVHGGVIDTMAEAAISYAAYMAKFGGAIIVNQHDPEKNILKNIVSNLLDSNSLSEMKLNMNNHDYSYPEKKIFEIIHSIS